MWTEVIWAGNIGDHLRLDNSTAVLNNKKAPVHFSSVLILHSVLL